MLSLNNRCNYPLDTIPFKSQEGGEIGPIRYVTARDRKTRYMRSFEPQGFFKLMNHYTSSYNRTLGRFKVGLDSAPGSTPIGRLVSIYPIRDLGLSWRRTHRLDRFERS